MGPELLIVAVSYYAAVFVSVSLVVGMTLRRSRKMSYIVTGIATTTAIAACVASKPGWEVPTATLFFAVSGIVTGLLIATWHALRSMFRSSHRRTAG